MPVADVFARCRRTLPELLLEQAERFAERTCLVTEAASFTYADMPDLAARWAGVLEDHGVRRGDRVAVMSENRLEVLELFLGCAWSGALLVPLNTAARGLQLQHMLDDAAPAVLALEHDVADRLGAVAALPASLERVWLLDGDAVPHEQPHGRALAPLPAPTHAARLVAPEPADTVAILYTSGTTGPSKGVESSHAQLTYWGEIVGGDWLHVTADDTLYTCMPLFHTNAINAFVQALVHGAAYHLGPRFSASRFWQRLADSGATVTYLQGAMVSILAARDPSPLDRAHAVTRALAPGTPADLWDPVRERFGIRIVEGHGMTETNGAIGPRDDEQRPGFMGRVMPGFHARVVDASGTEVPPGAAGELLLRADEPLAFASRYWRNEDATEAAWAHGWFHTGDRVVADADGYFRFVDRVKDAIRRRGENISAWEVEQVLLLHPAVAYAAAVAVPSPLGEDDVMACIVLRDGAHLDPAELVAFCEARLAYFAVPRYVEVFSELPLTGSGKVKKYELRERGVTATTWDREAAGIVVRR